MMNSATSSTDWNDNYSRKNMNYQDSATNYTVWYNNASSSFNTIYESSFTFTTNYIPMQSNVYNYDMNDISTGYTLQWDFGHTIHGLREYLFANNSYYEISELLLDMFLECDDEQEFEDNLYRLTLDLLYENVRALLFDLLDEQIYSYSEVNKVIDEIIDDYHTKRYKLEDCY